MTSAPFSSSKLIRDSEMHKAYIFLCRQSFETLRDIVKFWNVGYQFQTSVSGKPSLIAQIMCFMYETCETKQLSTGTEVLEGKD